MKSGFAGSANSVEPDAEDDAAGAGALGARPHPAIASTSISGKPRMPSQQLTSGIAGIRFLIAIAVLALVCGTITILHIVGIVATRLGPARVELGIAGLDVLLRLRLLAAARILWAARGVLAFRGG
jgi:hypothetical protein